MRDWYDMRLFVRFTCSGCGREVEDGVDGISTDRYDCESCGSHGHESIDARCPECGKEQSFRQDW